MTENTELICESMGQACQKMGEILEIGRPVSEAVLVSALEDDTYARYLLGSRNAPEVMEMLLANPSIKQEEEAANEGISRSTPELLFQAARALARWTQKGCKRADDETYARRLSACRACEHFSSPPDRVLYRLASAGSEEKNVCSLCGCVAATKARMLTEFCPAADRLNPALSRWQEPRGNGN